MKNFFATLVLLSCFSFSFAKADEMDSLKARFLERKDAVASLLQSGKAGENNKGFLEERASLSDDEKALLQAENGDRQKIYNAIAKKNGIDLTQVGATRAQKLAEQLPGGVYYQDASGGWKKK